jgi:putative endonuclease
MPRGYTYLLECADGSYYTGSTNDLKRRLREHQNQQGANYTKFRQQVKLVYYEEYSRIDIAFYREKQIQGWTHKKKQALIEGQVNLLPKLARKVFRLVASVQSPAAITQPPVVTGC